jgi:hypothetical protein
MIQLLQKSQGAILIRMFFDSQVSEGKIPLGFDMP